ICFDYLPKADVIITVCTGIADEYKKNYGVNSEVITNAPYFSDLTPSVTKESNIRIMYHGLVHKSRKSENMIYLMDHLDSRFELDFMIIRDNSRYCRKICDLAVNHPRISLRGTVSMPQISNALNEYDIGLFLLPPESFSYRMALPNKLFEFIQGRLAIAIWPSPEMARIVHEYKCGIVSEDFTIESIANRLNSLSEKDIMKFKQNSHKAAAFLCAEKNCEEFLSIVNKLLYS
ncbi:capsular biosynthesis protein, partial [bacterium]|nr:capsular biosynthesis protein [bacterium]